MISTPFAIWQPLSVSTPPDARILLTNNVNEKDHEGRIANAWLAKPQQDASGAWIAILDDGNQLSNITHWMDPLAQTSAQWLHEHGLVHGQRLMPFTELNRHSQEQLLCIFYDAFAEFYYSAGVIERDLSDFLHNDNPADLEPSALPQHLATCFDKLQIDDQGQLQSQFSAQSYTCGPKGTVQDATDDFLLKEIHLSVKVLLNMQLQNNEVQSLLQRLICGKQCVSNHPEEEDAHEV